MYTTYETQSNDTKIDSTVIFNLTFILEIVILNFFEALHQRLTNRDLFLLTINYEQTSDLNQIGIKLFS